MLPDEVQALLGWWTPRVRELLGRTYRAGILYGSVAAGDFAPGWSDVDVCVVVRAPPSAVELSGLERLHSEAFRRYVEDGEDGWRSGQAVDAIFMVESALADAASAEPAPFDRLSLHAHGRPLDDTRCTVAAPRRADLRRQLRSRLEELNTPPRSPSPIWLADGVAWLARALRYWRDGVVLTKSEALEGAAQAHPHQAAAFALSLQIRLEGSACAARQGDALRSAFEELRPVVLGLRSRMTDP